MYSFVLPGMFFVLLAGGLWLGRLRGIAALAILATWVALRGACSMFGFPWAAFIVVEVLLDCTLVIVIFGGDVRVR